MNRAHLMVMENSAIHSILNVQPQKMFNTSAQVSIVLNSVMDQRSVHIKYASTGRV